MLVTWTTIVWPEAGVEVKVSLVEMSAVSYTYNVKSDQLVTGTARSLLVSAIHSRKAIRKTVGLGIRLLVGASECCAVAQLGTSVHGVGV